LVAKLVPAVLLQTLERDTRGEDRRRIQAATSKSSAMKAACAGMSRPPMV